MTRLLTALAAASLLVALQPADARAYRFGTTPLNDVLYWSGQTTKRSGRTTNELAAMVLAPTWPKTGAGSSYTPSPMTLSRWDYASDRLWEGGDHRTAYPRSFFHPGVGRSSRTQVILAASPPKWELHGRSFAIVVRLLHVRVRPAGLKWRHWFQQDTGYAVTSYASRPSGKDVRSYSLWYQGRVLCDQSTGRGYCPPGG
jgi:hypothetical protein